MNVFTDQFHFPDGLAEYKVTPAEALQPGYFRFGKSVCYGRTSSGDLKSGPEADLYDVLRDVRFRRDDLLLPFDPGEVIDNLRNERYMAPARRRIRNAMVAAARKTYYTFRPLMPVRFRKHLQRVYLKDWERICFPAWPVDRTVENIFEDLIKLSLQSLRVAELPFIWFWPDGFSACSIMTHDIETEAGRGFSTTLADLDVSFGVKSAFQVVPEERYTVTGSFLDSLRSRGCEVNLHGLNHDGNLFRDRREFLRQVKRINQYAREYGATGFRSPVMYRNLEWYEDLEFSYDMSVPNAAHLEAQRGGCCTVMPYFIGDLVELPLTTTQDYALFNIVGQHSIDLWRRQIQLVTEKHGLLSFNIHPDYMISDSSRAVYCQLLAHLVQTCADQKIWMALPREVDSWWRQRAQMRLVKEAGRLRITGPMSGRATIAYARLKDGAIVYDVSDRTRCTRTSA